MVHLQAIKVEPASPEPDPHPGLSDPRTPHSRLTASCITPQWRSGKNTFRKLREAIARRSKTVTSTTARASGGRPSDTLDLLFNHDLFSVPLRSSERRTGTTRITPALQKTTLNDIDDDELLFTDSPTPVSNSNDMVRRHLGTFRSPSPDASLLSTSESLLEFDAESLLNPDFPTDVLDDNEGLFITEDVLQNQAGLERGRGLDEVYAEGVYDTYAILSSSLTLGSDFDMRRPIDSPMSTTSSAATSKGDVDFLCLGAGWLWQFLSPLLRERKITFAFTTTDGRDGSIKFRFNSIVSREDDNDDSNGDKESFSLLPRARTVLITFPVKGKDALRRLVKGYESTHPQNATQWILLGSTGVYSASPEQDFQWFDNESECTTKNERWEAEQALLEEYQGCVLNLAGLYGEPGRDGKIWERAVPRSKEGLSSKRSVHFIHGRDVARVILRVAKRFTSDRWLVADGRVYDWWELVWDNAEKLESLLDKDATPVKGSGQEEWTYRKWVLNLMQEQKVRALPRPVEMLGRGLDSRAVWRSLEIVPMEAKFAWPS